MAWWVRSGGAALALGIAGCGASQGAAGYDSTGGPSPGLDAGDAAVAVDATTPVDAAGETPADTARPARGAPYPIVLAHGFFGFNDFAGAGFETYFYGVKDDLAAHGEPNVFTPAVDPFNTSAIRGQQLYEHIRDILSTTGYAKVNIVGHSQGGLDARVVAHDHPDLVASVTMLATPNGGSAVSDAILGLVPGANQQALIDGFVNLVGGVAWNQLNSNSSVSTALAQFSTPGIATFNADYPYVASIPYFSIAGRSHLSDGGSDCATNLPPFWPAEWASARDPLNILFSGLSLPLAGSVNDGLVAVPAAKGGTFLGCIPADHVDEIGQILGQSPGLGNPYDHLAFFRDLALFLRAKGY